MTPSSPNPLTFQELILRLQTFFAERGCVLQQPYDVEVGAGTMAPETFLRVLGPQPYKVAYVQPSRRPADGRYGENPNRLFKHMQLQVILKPPPENIQELYLESLTAIGIDLRHHDIKFEEDNWESPTLGAWGIGWQVMLDGLEITQFTYFQQCGGLDLNPISVELTYGLERIAAFLQDVDSIYDIVWAREPESGSVVKYGDVRLADEQQFSVYNFEAADVEKTWRHFELYEAECKSLIRAPLFWYSAGPDSITWAWQEMVLQSITGRIVRITAGKHTELRLTPGLRYKFRLLQSNDNSLNLEVEQLHRKPTDRDLPFFVVTQTNLKGDETGWANVEGSLGRSASLLAAYDLCLKCSHLFNILDARGAISVTERVGVIARVRALAVGIAKAWVDQQKGETAAEKSDEAEPAREKKPKAKKGTLSPVGS